MLFFFGMITTNITSHTLYIFINRSCVTFQELFGALKQLLSLLIARVGPGHIYKDKTNKL